MYLCTLSTSNPEGTLSKYFRVYHGYILKFWAKRTVKNHKMDEHKWRQITVVYVLCFYAPFESWCSRTVFWCHICEPINRLITNQWKTNEEHLMASSLLKAKKERNERRASLQNRYVSFATVPLIHKICSLKQKRQRFIHTRLPGRRAEKTGWSLTLKRLSWLARIVLNIKPGFVTSKVIHRSGPVLGVRHCVYVSGLNVCNFMYVLL